MSSLPPTRSRAIIGVVGRTFRPDKGPDDELLQLAQKVGKLIAAKGHIVLTGGHHERRETSVKYRALVGAAQGAPDIARVIGMLPRSISAAVDVEPVKACLTPNEPPLRGLYVHTGLSGHGRNWLTGNAVDALIALKGETGTPEEVDAAVQAGRPVVFLESWHVLQPKLKCPPSNPQLAETPDEAVDMALSALGLLDDPASTLQGSLPETCKGFDPPETYPRLKDEYEEKLAQLRA